MNIQNTWKQIFQFALVYHCQSSITCNSLKIEAVQISIEEWIELNMSNSKTQNLNSKLNLEFNEKAYENFQNKKTRSIKSETLLVLSTKSEIQPLYAPVEHYFIIKN